MVLDRLVLSCLGAAGEDQACLPVGLLILQIGLVCYRNEAQCKLLLMPNGQFVENSGVFRVSIFFLLFRK